MEMDLLAYSDLLLPADILLPLILITFPIGYMYLTKEITSDSLYKKSLCCISLIVFGSYVYALNVKYLNKNKLNEQIESYRNNIKTGEYYNQYTVLFHSVIEWFREEITSNFFSDEDKLLAKREISEMTMKNISEIRQTGDSERNLIIILIESFNHIGLKPDVMPFVHSLTQDTANIFVPKVEHNIQLGMSMDGQVITLAGLHPANDRFIFRVYPDVELPSIYKSANVNLNTQGSLYTITNKNFWRQDYAAKSMGIDSIYGNEKIRGNNKEWLTDNELFDNIIVDIDLDQNKRKIYTILTGDSHTPFDDDRPELSVIKEENRSNEHYPFFISLQYTDFQIKRFFEALENSGELKNSTILITADHSLPLFNNNHIPMLIYNPVNHSSYRPKCIPQQISIYPTLLSAAGIIDSTYMGLTPPMTSPRIDEFSLNDFERAKVISEMIQYNELLLN